MNIRKTPVLDAQAPWTFPPKEPEAYEHALVTITEGLRNALNTRRLMGTREDLAKPLTMLLPAYARLIGQAMRLSPFLQNAFARATAAYPECKELIVFQEIDGQVFRVAEVSSARSLVYAAGLDLQEGDERHVALLRGTPVAFVGDKPASDWALTEAEREQAIDYFLMMNDQLVVNVERMVLRFPQTDGSEKLVTFSRILEEAEDGQSAKVTWYEHGFNDARRKLYIRQMEVIE
jgi:hypothetical protein